MFTSVLPFFDNSVNLRVEKIIEKYRGVKIKWGVSMLVAVCLVIYYIPRYSFTSSFNASSVSREWLLRPLNRYVLSAYDYKYYVLKKTQWENPVIAEQMFEVLKTEYLSYDVLIIGAEVKEYLGKYEESLGYYNQASLVRPFTLFPKYKRLLIYNHLGDVTSRVRVLKEIDSLNLRIQNEVTNKMLEEISEIRSSTQVN
jgi:hypothetical protein